MVVFPRMRTLYFDCFSGISGDMTIGALLDLGLDLGYLRTELQKLPQDGYSLTSARVVRANISATKFDVNIAGDGANAHHEHTHEHPHADQHRKASEILSMIRSSALNANSKRLAESIFTKLAISEGNVHRVPPEDVEFHEVGAVDSIVDTVGAAIGFDALGIERFVCSSINVGGGFIHCQHGVYPVPVPATADLLRGASIYSKHVSAELVTPTGAAILAATVDDFRSVGFSDIGFSVDRIGYGAGTKQFQNFPNCLRLLMGEEKSGATGIRTPESTDDFMDIIVIEANIDDMTPQNFAYVTERLLDAGALDVCTIPVQMKKGRSGFILQVLSPMNRSEILSKLIFQETTSIGIRQYVAKRTALEREIVFAETRYGRVAMKVSRQAGMVVSCTPEYEDCARIAREHNVPLKEIQSLATKAYLDCG
jgi:pyridinium-3,5-bisthiocarboxylic acid mononucleotide nickel chelatase